MATRFFVTSEGVYIGGFDVPAEALAGLLPDGAVEVPNAPADARDLWVDGAFVPHVPPPPAIVTPLQARKALRQAGLKSTVDAHIATLSEEEQEEWEYATVIERTNPILNAAAVALGLTEAQVDDLFRLAAEL